ncbi:peptidase M4 family protein [Cytobacillus oceanisediminis]|uniref:M4 family metallopeptidase n=1 Tax=Cytobacillus oceanisediminis TaxID=665099 RepID=UPI001CCEE13E|nr:M4 family metallopeptidase [Cytobacillus oceanisediminis]MBZ9533200.1 peptidase M4 family protein [Cytobacillus oceanisediminis]
MKKSLSLLLATGLVFGAAIPSGLAASNEQKKLEKFQLSQKNWDNKKDLPTFLSGKLSTKKYKVEKEIRAYLKENETLYKINPSKDLTLLEETTDELGMKHYQYVQSVNGVPIEGAAFYVHTNKAGEVVAVNGGLHPEASKKVTTTKAKLADKDAIEKAWKHLDLSKEETSNGDTVELKGLSSKAASESTTVEKDSLVVFEKNGIYHLAYKVEFQFIDPYPANWQIFVDANDGTIIDSLNAVTDAATTGRGTGVNGDTKTLNTYFSNGTYYLYDTTKPMSGGVIQTATAQNRSTLPGVYSTDADNAWTASNQRADVDAHYYAGVVYDYYYNTHNRNSYDNRGASITSTVHYQTNYNNAFWNGSQMVYGDGDGTTFAPLSGALDVVAHEITHAVTERTAGLQYQNQSGALNESMSDVFGYFLDPNDWLLGEDVYTPRISGDGLRSLSNPESYGQPSTMSNYVNTTSDNGGVHINSGIPNKAAYYTISSIGKAQAEKIYYRALTTYLTPTSNFSNAKSALLQAASDLYGSNSSTYNAVKSAWDRVGVN